MSDHFSSSDEDLEEIVNLIETPRNLNYFEETVPEYNEEQYQEHFRLSRRKTAELAQQFEASEYFHRQKGDSLKMSPEKYITTFLWFAAHEAGSFRDVADRFNMTKSSLHKIITRVTYFLSNLSAQIITWPNENEKVNIERHFRQNGFPGVIGAIDGTHIRIDKPGDDPDSYLNRKHYFSIQAQVVCDHRRVIRDIFVGYPGSVHDSRVLRASPLFRTLPQKCYDYFLLGDSGYPCLANLLTPFRDRGQLTRRQRNYNYALSKHRYVIEHCFGVMKQRFRQLYHLKLRNIRNAVHFIRACAVLHNFSVTDSLNIQDEEVREVEDDNAFVEVGEREENEDEQDGIHRRNFVMNNLPFILH